MNKNIVYIFIFFLCSLHGIRATFGSREFSGFWVLFLTVWNSNLLHFLSLDCVTADPGRRAFLFPEREAVVSSLIWLSEVSHLSIWLSDVSHLFPTILRWHFDVRSTVERNISLAGSVPLICSLIPCGIHFRYQLFLVCC